MRGAFGLVALLVAFAIVIWLFSTHTSTVATSGVKAQEDARQLAGVARDGEMRFMDSLTIEASTSGGRTVAMLVTDVKPQGPAAAHFGLQRDDLITQIGEFSVKDNLPSAEDALGELHNAYARKWTLQVIRNDQPIMLPGGTPAAAVSGAPAAAAPQQPPPDNRGSLQRQLDNITGPR
jgi:anionic cell wall polymer biosynthesis LytR-Cps2A-Psr (LCP) family protein